MQPIFLPNFARNFQGMKTLNHLLHVGVSSGSYPVALGCSMHKNFLTAVVASLQTKTAIVVTNSTIDHLYTSRIKDMTSNIHAELKICLIREGEEYKTFDSLDLIFKFLLENQCDRNTIIYALGGGVIGDITGFAAATYMRGIRFIQVPTTLLAMVDSSVGGKTGINHPLGKNMIGAFHQPIAVIADVSVLDTLPDREMRCGVAEIIKHACIADIEYFEWLETNVEKLLARDTDALIHAIKRSVEIKAAVVQADEKENDIRAILNFGHTFGHAIEAGLGFGVWLHGEAVGAGLVAAATLSHHLGQLSESELGRIRSLVARAGLSATLPHLPLGNTAKTQAQRYLELMRLDKKSSGGKIRYIVLKGLGKAYVYAIDDDVITRVIESCLA
jgi:3-dehydroquinate synthase